MIEENMLASYAEWKRKKRGIGCGESELSKEDFYRWIGDQVDSIY